MCVTPRLANGSLRPSNLITSSWRIFPRGARIGTPRSSRASLERPSRTGPKSPLRRGGPRT
eukprot:9962918-Alexandrium_andersonii.AAC.1